MSLAPVEYVVLAFPGEAPLSELAPALEALVDSREVHILDLMVVRRDPEGVVTSEEVDELAAAAAFDGIEGEVGGLLGVEDVSAVAQELSPGSWALLIVWEDLWARDLSDTVLRLGGEIVAGARLPSRAVEVALLDLENSTDEENQS